MAVGLRYGGFAPFWRGRGAAGHLIVVSTLLMLLIVVPVLALIFLFAWRYRASNTKATYSPDWDHSTGLELVIWQRPAHHHCARRGDLDQHAHLDPYRRLSRLDATRPIPATSSLDRGSRGTRLEWLFIYPDLGIATVNELAAPLDVPINFKITASSVMNSFYIPALAARSTPCRACRPMSAVINRAGEYEGFPPITAAPAFRHALQVSWREPKRIRRLGTDHTRRRPIARQQDYLQLEKPSERDPCAAIRWSATGLYDAILNQCIHNSC